MLKIPPQPGLHMIKIVPHVTPQTCIRKPIPLMYTHTDSTRITSSDSSDSTLNHQPSDDCVVSSCIPHMNVKTDHHAHVNPNPHVVLTTKPHTLSNTKPDDRVDTLHDTQRAQKAFRTVLASSVACTRLTHNARQRQAREENICSDKHSFLRKNIHPRLTSSHSVSNNMAVVPKKNATVSKKKAGVPKNDVVIIPKQPQKPPLLMVVWYSSNPTSHCSSAYDNALVSTNTYNRYFTHNTETSHMQRTLPMCIRKTVSWGKSQDSVMGEM